MAGELENRIESVTAPKPETAADSPVENLLGVKSAPMTAEAVGEPEPTPGSTEGERKAELARLALSEPELRDWYEQQKKDINDRFQEREDRINKQRMVEMLTQAVTQFGAAMVGQKRGADMSNLKFIKTDFERQLDRVTARRESEEKGLTDELSARRRLRELMEDRSVRRQQIAGQRTGAKPRIETRTVIDPKTGRRVAKSFEISSDGGVKELGTLGQAPISTRRDPDTGELIDIDTGEVVSGKSGGKVQAKGVYGKLPPQGKKFLDTQAEKFATETKVQRSALETITGLESAIDLAQHNEVAAAQLGARLAQLFESGRLTDEDVKRYGIQKSLLSRLDNFIVELDKGVITKDRAEEIRQTLKEFAGATRQAVVTRAKQKADLVAGRYDISADEVVPLIYSDSPKEEKSQESGMVDMVAPDGRKLRVPAGKVKELEAKGAKRQ